VPGTVVEVVVEVDVVVVVEDVVGVGGLVLDVVVVEVVVVEGLVLDVVAVGMTVTQTYFDVVAGAIAVSPYPSS
jgi:hypothetical protein